MFALKEHRSTLLVLIVGVCIGLTVIVAWCDGSSDPQKLWKKHKYLARVPDKPATIKQRDIKAGVGKMTRITLRDKFMAFSIPSECDEVMLNNTETTSFASISYYSQKWFISLVLDRDRMWFRGSFRDACKDMAETLGDEITPELAEHLGDLLKVSDEELFRKSLSQTKKTLMSAGADKKKLLMAFMGLDFRAKGSVVDKYELVALKRNHIYLGASHTHPKTGSVMWVFDSSGTFLGRVGVPTKRLAIGLQVADTIERMKKRK